MKKIKTELHRKLKLANYRETMLLLWIHSIFAFLQGGIFIYFFQLHNLITIFPVVYIIAISLYLFNQYQSAIFKGRRGRPIER